ncbi:hypothetical protein [Parvibaculum sp. MBR-TMA-1.3b-4.2]|jgi:hypothetical protein
MSFPADFDCLSIVNNWSGKPQDNAVRFEPEIGPSIDRRRGTAAGEEGTVTYGMTRAQLVAFKSWFTDSVKSGTLSWTMTHPEDGLEKSFKFTKDLYRTQKITGDWYQVTLSLRVLP